MKSNSELIAAGFDPALCTEEGVLWVDGKTIIPWDSPLINKDGFNRLSHDAKDRE